MRIHIIGPGVVGRATASLMGRFGQEVVVTDRGDLHAEVRADIHMVCTPEAVAPEVVRSLLMDGVKAWSNGVSAAVPKIPDNEIVVVRSSVPPGTCQDLSVELRRPVFHIPEFLREATAEADAIEARTVLIGEPMRPIDPDLQRVQMFLLGRLTRLYYQDLRKEVFVTWSTETEFLKLANNTYLAALLSLWNELGSAAASLGLNIHHVGRLMAENDKRISPYGALRMGTAYGGSCLPKDVAQMRKLMEDRKVPGPLLAAVHEVNERMKGVEAKK